MTRKAVLNTDHGKMTIELYTEKMPNSCARFIEIVQKGEFNAGNIVWHRVEDWVIQTGDKIRGYKPIKLEIDRSLRHTKGAVGLARTSDPHSATTQFYIVKRDSTFLDGNYAMFGMVVDGQQVMEKVREGDRVVSIKMLD
jgi:peptidyl-prolyl cis-trans isomerase B (cyclophilin B)